MRMTIRLSARWFERLAGGDDPFLGHEFQRTFEVASRFKVLGLMLVAVSVLSGVSGFSLLWHLSDDVNFLLRLMLSCLAFFVSSLIVFNLYRLFLCITQGDIEDVSLEVRFFRALPSFFLFVMVGFFVSLPLLFLSVEEEARNIENESRFLRLYRDQVVRLDEEDRLIRTLYLSGFANNQMPSELELPKFLCLDKLRDSELVRRLSYDQAAILSLECRSEIDQFRYLAEAGKIRMTESYRDWDGDWDSPNLRILYIEQLSRHYQEIQSFEKGFLPLGLVTILSQIFSIWPEYSAMFVSLFILFFLFPYWMSLLMSRLPMFYFRREMWRLYLASRFGIYIDAFRVFDRHGDQFYVDIYSQDKHVLVRALKQLSYSKPG